MSMEDNRDGCFNIARVCRFCLSQTGVMSPIFENGDPSLPSLAAKIMAFARIQLFMNDGLPTILCHRCLYLAERAFDFKSQCEASDAMLRKYLAMMQVSVASRQAIKLEPSLIPMESPYYPKISDNSLSIYQSSNSESPFKRKRGRPRKEENLIFYSSPAPPTIDPPQLEKSSSDEIKIVNGIESVVTVVDPRCDILSNSDEDLKKEKATIEAIEREKPDADTLRSLAIARAKAKKYMGVIVGVDDNGAKTRRHLCKGCGKTFGHCSDLRKHVLVHTGERPFHCQLCTKTFSRSTNLNKHLKVHSGQKPFTCSNCPKSFATKGDLQRHQVIHSGLKPFSCDLCHQCFSRKDKLTRHVKLHGAPFSTRVNNVSNWTGHSIGVREDDNTNRVGCLDHFDLNLVKAEGESSEETLDAENVEPIEEYGDKTAVESMVIDIDPFNLDSDPIDPCSKKTGNDDDEPQMDVLTDGKSEGSHQCGQCQLSFADIAQLSSHIADHGGEKPHKCNQCSKSFSRRRELLRHENVHTGLKPYICTVCLKAFARKDKLVRHRKIHDGFKLPGKKRACDICHVGFYKEHLYLEHIETHALLETDSDDDRPLRENGCADSEDANSDEESVVANYSKTALAMN